MNHTQSADSADVLPPTAAAPLDPAPALTVESESRGKPRVFQLGVLLVHGIGTQPARKTLVQWSEDLLGVIGLATKGQVVPRVERARPGEGSSEEPAEAAVRISTDEHEELWLLSEGWWADTFPAPSYRELVSWGVRAVPWAVAVHIAQRYWQKAAGRSGPRRFLPIALAVLQLLLALALAPVFIVVLALTLVLGLLPIPQLRSLILSVQSALTGTVGDSLAFVESPVRAALIRTRILESLERLTVQCRHTVIIAHSQGAAAALDALGGITEAAYEGEDSADPLTPVAGPVPDTLVTFGAGINQLVSLKVLARGLPKKMGLNPSYLAMGAQLAAVALFGYMFAEVRAGRATILSLLHAAAVLAVSFLLGALLLWAIKSSVRKRAGKREISPKRDKVTSAVAVILLLAIVGAAIFYADRHDLLMGPVNFLFFALVMLATSLAMILSHDVRKAISTPVREPAGLARWVDLYASADPVPNGPTRIKKVAILESVPIWNRGSFFSDHTTYWSNRAGFTLRVARVCAETARSPWVDTLPPVTPAADSRAAWRVRLLRLARLVTSLAWLFVLGLSWNRYGRSLQLPFHLPTWAPPGTPTVMRWALLVVLTAAAVWATARLLLWPWARWVRTEEATYFETGSYPTGTPLPPLALMATVFAIVVSLAVTLARGGPSLVQEIANDIARDPRNLVGPVALFGGWGLILAFLTRWLFPAPRP